jgi:hypothetical protein
MGKVAIATIPGHRSTITEVFNVNVVSPSMQFLMKTVQMSVLVFSGYDCCAVCAMV